MSELRHDPLDDRWILMAPDRARRPRFQPAGPVRPEDPGLCPFCPGNESHTRPALAVVSASDEGAIYREVDGDAGVEGWWVRVVPNRYPMLEVETDAEEFGAGRQRGLRGLGAHEVVIETPRHDADLGDLGDEALAAVVRTWRERLRDLYRDTRLAQVQVFRNRGALAGATVVHSHSQVVALPFVPPRLQRQRGRMEEELQRCGRGLLDAMWSDAREAGDRVLIDRDGVGVFAPWASANRYELVLLMPEAPARFQDLDDGHCLALASALAEACRRVRSVLDDPPCHLALFAEPNPAVESVGAGFRWHLRLVPRLGPMAGFEWMSEVQVNTTPPEEAVAQLRRAEDPA